MSSFNISVTRPRCSLMKKYHTCHRLEVYVVTVFALYLLHLFFQASHATDYCTLRTYSRYPPCSTFKPISNDTEGNAAGRSVRACVARKSKSHTITTPVVLPGPLQRKGKKAVNELATVTTPKSLLTPIRWHPSC